MTPYERETNLKMQNLQKKLSNLNEGTNQNFPFKTKTTNATDSIKLLFQKPNSNIRNNFETSDHQRSFNPEVTGFSQNSVNKDFSPVAYQAGYKIQNRRVNSGYSPIDMARKNSREMLLRNSGYVQGHRNNQMMRSITSTRTD